MGSKIWCAKGACRYDYFRIGGYFYGVTVGGVCLNKASVNPIVAPACAAKALPRFCIAVLQDPIFLTICPLPVLVDPIFLTICPLPVLSDPICWTICLLPVLSDPICWTICPLPVLSDPICWTICPFPFSLLKLPLYFGFDFQVHS